MASSGSANASAGYLSTFSHSISWLDFGVVAALGLVAFILLYRPGSKRKNLPPSPGVFPIVGSFPLMDARAGEPAHQMFGRLGDKFGPIVYLRMGANPTIIISNSDFARQVLKDKDHLFASRPYISAGKYLGMNFNSVVFAPSGAFYKRIRKIFTVELLSPKRVTAAHETRENGVFETLGSIYRDQMDEKATNLSSVLRDLSLTSLLGMIFGRKDGKMLKKIGTVDLEDLKEIVRRAVELGGEFNFGDFIAIARWLDLQGVMGRMKKLSKHMKVVAAALIDEYERTGKKNADAADATILDVLLSLDGEDKLSPEAMAGVMFDMIIAGSDTTSASSDWTIAELLRQPQLIAKLKSELDDVVGRERFVRESDIPKLPYLQAVIKESLRLHPPAPLGIPHCSVEDCKLGEFDIPAGTTALVNLWKLNRDARHWEEPLKFDPDRFLNMDVGVFGSAYHLLPFSSGRRGCSGMLLGLTMVQLIVANLVHSFDFQACGMRNEDIDVITETTGLVSVRAKDLIVNATLTLPSYVFEDISQ